MRVLIKATIVNSQEKKFEVRGAFWDDGSFYVKNPRPLRYPEYIGLGFKPAWIDEEHPRRLYWLKTLEDLDSATAPEASKFYTRSMLLDPKPPKRRVKKK